MENLHLSVVPAEEAVDSCVRAVIPANAGIPKHLKLKDSRSRHIRRCGGFLPTVPIALLVFLCSPTAHAQTAADFQCSPFRQVGKFRAAEITECSGLVVSRRNPGILWVHNDSGDTARLFAVKPDGSLRGVYDLSRAGALDWEDMALGPCPDKGMECLYVGDIGDNKRRRPQVQVYRVEEPSVPLQGPPVRARLPDTVRFDCKYPDAPHDAETLFIDPVLGIPYLVTKERRGSAGIVYRFPGKPHPDNVATLERVATLTSLSSLTGGDISRDGSLVLLRDYFTAYAYQRPGTGRLSDAFALPPRRIRLGDEAQGESLGLGPNGNVIYTASEGAGGPIHRASCKLFRPRATPSHSSSVTEEAFEPGS
jgi:hypothetical protein